MPVYQTLWAVTEPVQECCEGMIEGTSVIALFASEQTARQLADKKAGTCYVQPMKIHQSIKTVPDYLQD